MSRLPVAALITIVGCCCLVRADTLTLKDGTILEGSVIKEQTRYWVSLTNGKSVFVPLDQVASLTTDDGTAVMGNVTNKAAVEFNTVKAQADKTDQPIVGVALWQKFMDNKPSADMAAKGQVELDAWRKLVKDSAERINGKWVGGDERKQIIEQAEGLYKEAIVMINDHQTMQAFKKLREAIAVYPNMYDVNVYLGALSIELNKPDDAQHYLEQAQHLEPTNPSAINNIGVFWCLKRNYERGIGIFTKQLETQDDGVLAFNLGKALSMAPPAIRNSAIGREANDTVTLMMDRYHINAADFETKNFLFAFPREDAPKSNLPAGAISAGTGFIVNEDGTILTNRHVVKEATAFLVLLDDGEQVSANLVTIDKDQDLALLRINPANIKTKLHTLSLMGADLPASGAQCYAIGFPLPDKLGATLKVTQGIVSGTEDAGPVDVLIDAKVNPGNSGGPLMDKYANVMGIVTMKSITNGREDSYGMAISAGKLRTFLVANKIVIADPNPPTAALSAEDVVAKVRSATVCIIATH